ncbi:MAG: conjugal transfer protein TraF [Gammaproteobacteria bacterium]|nr:conjugal transfer protein TraF [Gammaproteobacteria bacterium]
MFKKSLLAAGIMAAGISTVSAATYGYFDARSVAMGNVSVATGGLTTAAFGNPAMLAVNETNEKFVFHLGLGIAAIDNGGIIDGIDDFQALDSTFDSQVAASDVPGAVATLQQEIDLLNSLNNSSLVLDANTNTALVYSGDTYTFAVNYNARGNAGVALQNITVPTLGGTIPAALPTADIYAIGTLTKEIGFSVARKMSFMGMNLAVGVTPKQVSVETIDYKVGIDTADVADITDENPEDLGSFTSLDAGVVLGVTDSINLGFVAKNLIEKTLTTSATVNSPSRDINFDRLLRVGASYHNSFFTLAADLDLSETDPILNEDASKMMSVGIELDAFDIVQLRGGIQKNIASGASTGDLMSVGVGLWLGMNLDIAAVKSDDSLGVFVQTGFRF